MGCLGGPANCLFLTNPSEVRPMPHLSLVSICAFNLVFVLASSTVLADEPVADEPVTDEAAQTFDEQIKGDWVRYHDTPQGRFMTIKTHLGERTVLTTYDPNRKAVSSFESEYVVDESGPVPVFRYQNKVVLIGPNRGARDPREKAYIFRVTADEFYEVHGMMPSDKKKPGLILWERLKVNPISKPST